MTRPHSDCPDCRPLPHGGVELCAVHAEEPTPSLAGIRVVAFTLGCLGTLVTLVLVLSGWRGECGACGSWCGCWWAVIPPHGASHAGHATSFHFSRHVFINDCWMPSECTVLMAFHTLCTSHR